MQDQGSCVLNVVEGNHTMQHSISVAMDEFVNTMLR